VLWILRLFIYVQKLGFSESQILDTFNQMGDSQCSSECGDRTQKTEFTHSEDTMLAALVGELGRKHWIHIAARMQHRTARQCRERWVNYLNPELSRAAWTDAEDDILRTKYREIGPKWVKISLSLPGRSSNSIKNRAFVLERQDRQTHPMGACR
jgi:hypothetical protein